MEGIELLSEIIKGHRTIRVTTTRGQVLEIGGLDFVRREVSIKSKYEDYTLSYISFDDICLWEIV